jgi:hypothetical protein
MEPPSYMRSVIDWNVIVQHMTVPLPQHQIIMSLGRVVIKLQAYLTSTLHEDKLLLPSHLFNPDALFPKPTGKEAM